VPAFLTASGSEAKYWPFHFPVDQYCVVGFSFARTTWLTPLGSSSSQYTPVAGLIEFFLETRRRFRPVMLSHPIFIPGKNVSVGWSKLCHKVCDEFETFLRIKFPLSRSMAMVLFLVILAWVDQITELVDWIKTTRLPSLEILSSSEVGLLLLKGSSLFATHA